MKKFLFVMLMLAVVAVAVLFLVAEKLDGRIERMIEETGTETLGQQVKVGSVDIDLKGRAGEITGLRIDNPEGFTDAEVFRVDRIRLAIELSSVGDNPLKLPEMIIEAPAVSLEIREDGSSNLDQMIAHLRAREAAAPDEQPTAEDGEPLRLAVGDLRITGVQLTLRHPKFGEEARELVLPDIEIENLGKEEGVTPAGLGVAVLEAVAKEGTKEALKAEAKKQAIRLLEKAGESLRGDSGSDESE